MRTTKKTGTGRLLALATLVAVLGLATGARSEEPDTADEPSADATDAGAAEAAADQPEATADHDEADASDRDAEHVAGEREPDAEATAEDDESPLADDAEDYADGSTPADEFMTADWAPDVPVDESDDALPTDRSLDPSGLGWEVAPASGDADRSHGSREPRHHGDYAGPSQILEMRPRQRGSAPSRPAGERDRDTAYSYGGKPIEPGSAPWQAQIYRSLAKERPGVPRWKAQHNCGGTLIAPDWILTAAHCIDDIIDDREAGWRVRLGGQDLARDDGATYVVDRWVRHSGYRKIGHPDPPKAPVPPPNMYSSDIGLVHIRADAQTRPIADPKRVHPVVLYRKPIKGGDEVTAIGWGMTENTAKSFSAVPLKVDLRVMDTTLCQSRPGYGPERIGGTVICAAREGQKTCRGDSGGPVILTNGTVAQLVGLVSWGKNDCSGDGRPSVFTRVESYLGWIDQAMKLPETRASLP